MSKTSKLRLGILVGVASATFVSGCAGAGSPRSSGTQTKYTLRAGDSFYRVAGKFDIDPVDLAAANGLSLSSMLHPGDELVIPGADGGARPTTTTRVRSAAGSNAATSTTAVKTTLRDAAPASVADANYELSAAQRTELVRLAKSKMNATYQWGATGPNKFDCSGYIYWLFNQVGVDLPRLTSPLYAAQSVTVPRSQLRPGDLVFFHTPVSHMGVYIGDGMMAEAASSALDMRISSIDRASLVKLGRM